LVGPPRHPGPGISAMHLHGCKQTPDTPPTTTDEESSGSTSDDEMKKKKGNRAMGKKKYPKAIKYYTKAVKIDPENPTYRLNRAIANAALELWKDAETDAASAVELGNPASSKSHYQLARAKLKRGSLDEASEALKAGLDAFPKELALLQLGKEIDRARAVREAKLQKEAEAQAARRAAAAHEGPASAKALLEQARAAYASNRPEDAVRLSQEARQAAAAVEGDEARREEISACSLLGKTAMRLRVWDQAEKAFERACEIQEAVYSMDKNDEREALANAYNNLGIARKNGGKLSEAVEALNTSYAKATNFDDQVATPQVLQNLAQALVQQGKIEEARGMYSRALEVGQRLYGPDHASHGLNHLGIARCLKKEGNLGDAIRAYTTAYELWTKKDPQVCLAEMPEVPTKERFSMLQEQCRQELAQIVLFVEEAKKRAAAGEGGGGEGGEAAPATGSEQPSGSSSTS